MMTPQEELQQLGLSYEPDPPRRDARQPLSMVFRILGEGSCLAFAGLEIERYRIETPENGVAADSQWRSLQQSWTRAVDALSHLRDEIEFWHVVATRKTTRSRWLHPAQRMGRGRPRGDGLRRVPRGRARARCAALDLRQPAP